MAKQRYLTVDLYRAELDELQRARDILIKTIDQRISNIQKLVDRLEEDKKDVKKDVEENSVGASDIGGRDDTVGNVKKLANLVREKEKTEIKREYDTLYPFKLYLEQSKDLAVPEIKNNLSSVALVSGLDKDTTIQYLDGMCCGDPIFIKKITPHHAIILFASFEQSRYWINIHSWQVSDLQNKSDTSICIANWRSGLLLTESDTVIVKNIPDYLLNVKDITNLMETFGKVERVLIQTNEDDEQLDSAYVVFNDKEMVKRLVYNHRPFKNYKNKKSFIEIEPSKHLMSAEELDTELGNYILGIDK